MSRRRLVLLSLVGALAWFAVAVTPPSVTPAAASAQAGSAQIAREATAVWRQVDAGAAHTCAVRSDGRLFCWGRGDHGELGNGAEDDHAHPVEVAGGRTDWAVVSAGTFHTCARRRTGQLYCWGQDDWGQLGDGGTNTSRSQPVEVVGGRTDWAGVVASGGHTCAVRRTGRLFCWGDDSVGQLGDGGTNTPQPQPVEVAGGRTDWATVTAGDGHTCARRITSRLFCWGRDDHGQRGDGGGVGPSTGTPVQVAGNRVDWVKVSAGSAHTCARRSDGRLFCWGFGTYGQRADGTHLANRGAPFEVVGGRTDWSGVAAGGQHTCARRSTGRLFCAGYDGSGQLGVGGGQSDRATPTQVAGARTDWSAVTAGGGHTCALRASGRLFCWGANAYGQLGDGGSAFSQPTPVEVTL
jgi:alpha-tubulin suppressor-like RCC1 family protein